MNWNVIAGGMGLVLFLGVCYFLGGKMVDEQSLKEVGAQPSVSRTASKATTAPAKVKKGQSALASTQKGVRKGLLKRPTVNVTTNSTIPASEKIRLDDLQLALDEEDMDKLRLVVPSLARSASPDVRSKVVESLRWFKQRALPELKSMLSDTDPDVACDAKDGWLEAVNEITDEGIKGKELYDGMVQMQDVDALREAIMGYYSMEDGLAVEYITQLINSGNPGAGLVGREGYEHITGETYSTPEAAQRFCDGCRKNNPVVGSVP